MSLIIPNEEAGATEIIREAIEVIFSRLQMESNKDSGKVSDLNLDINTLNILEDSVKDEAHFLGELLTNGTLHKYHCDLALLGIIQR